MFVNEGERGAARVAGDSAFGVLPACWLLWQPDIVGMQVSSKSLRDILVEYPDGNPQLRIA